MRPPRPPLISNAEAARVVRDALEYSFGALDQRLAEKVLITSAEWTEAGAIAAAKRGKFKPLANLLKFHPRVLGPEAHALIAARLRGEFKGKRGQPKRKLSERSLNYARALELPFIEQVLQAHYPHVSVTKAWAIDVAAIAFDLNERQENNFRKFLGSRHRPRRPLP